MSIKLEIARAQLGTALHHFLKDEDPFSVQALACGGYEILEGLVEAAGNSTFSTHIMETIPDIDSGKIRKLRNQYWNAIKHFYTQNHRTVRDDEALLADFTDAANDAPLFIGWTDYLKLTKKLPVEAQVFQVWWYATNEARLKPDVDLTPHRTLFPKITSDNRKKQKQRLRLAVDEYQNNKDLLNDPRTEKRALIQKV